MKIGIVPCSKEKIWDVQPKIGPVRADQAYRSAFHRYARNYALKHCTHCLIFSAKYGLMEPDFIIQESYDITFSRPDDPCITESELNIQAAQYAHADEIVILCPRSYADKLRIAFGHITLRFPLENVGGWGAMHTWLKNHT